MKEYKSFTDLWDEVEKDESYLVEKTILEFTLQLHQLIKLRKLSKKDLAGQLNTSQAYITKVFRGNANFTIGTMTKLASALGGKLSIHITPEEEQIERWFKVLKVKDRGKNTQAWQKSIVCEDVGIDQQKQELCIG